MKIKVKYAGGVNPAGTDEVWGGSKATFNAFIKSFENDPEVELTYKDRTYFFNNSKIFNVQLFKEHIKDADIVHIDDTSIVEEVYKAGLDSPDVIGPIARSPIKKYTNEWVAPYTKEWFYKAEVIRLNYNEERQSYIDSAFNAGTKSSDLVTLINHGIDTDFLKPSEVIHKRQYVMWAGMIPRYAKNYELMEEIMKITKLPQGYEWKVMSNFKVQDYWDALDRTAILINTSRYETFCCALFEARSKGVATIQPNLLNGPDVHINAPIQVEYKAEAYRDMILELLNNNTYIKKGKESREYCTSTASLREMRDSFYSVYKKIMSRKNG